MWKRKWRTWDKLKVKLSNLTNTYANNCRPSNHAMKKHGILKCLHKNSFIFMTTWRQVKVDGQKHLYSKDIWDNKRLHKIHTSSTDPTITRESQLQRFLRSTKDNHIFTKWIYGEIYPSSSKPEFIYGTARVHKLKHSIINGLSLRPTISSLGTLSSL